jgi:hypothetical protein
MRLVEQGGQPWKDNKILNGGTYCSQIHTLLQSKHIRQGLYWFRGDVQIGVRDGLACFEVERVLWGTSISITCPCYKWKLTLAPSTPARKSTTTCGASLRRSTSHYVLIMSTISIGPIRKAWHRWKSLQLPWRKRFLVGTQISRTQLPTTTTLEHPAYFVSRP